MCNLHCITLFALVLHFFALVLHILHSFLSQSESSNFIMYIINLHIRSLFESILLYTFNKIMFTAIPIQFILYLYHIRGKITEC